jgi:hypothetical protein
MRVFFSIVPRFNLFGLFNNSEHIYNPTKMTCDVKLGGLLFLILFESVRFEINFCIVDYFFVVFSDFNVIVWNRYPLEGWVFSELQEKPIIFFLTARSFYKI